MTPEAFRNVARRLRELALITRTEHVREQLLVWADDFEAEAEAAECPKQECGPSH